MKTLFAIAATLLMTISFYGQTEEEVKENILKYDTDFWAGYNSCNSTILEKYLAENVEFYHDKGGITLGSKNLTESIQKNLCSNSNFKIRRAIVPNTINFYPLKKDNILYGALLTGEHYFYVTENGQKESLDGRANFTHLWLLENNQWKMAKIISYNHGPAQK